MGYILPLLSSSASYYLSYFLDSYMNDRVSAQVCQLETDAMVIILALIIVSIFIGTLFAIARLNQIEITMKSEIRNMETRLRLIDIKLQNIIDSHETSTARGDFIDDAGEKFNPRQYSSDDSDIEYLRNEKEDLMITSADDVEEHLIQDQADRDVAEKDEEFLVIEEVDRVVTSADHVYGCWWAC